MAFIQEVIEILVWLIKDILFLFLKAPFDWFGFWGGILIYVAVVLIPIVAKK